MDDFSRFAPAYFTYMADCLDNEVRATRDLNPLPVWALISSAPLTARCQRPTALAKIFGVYKMGYTSSRGALRMNGESARATFLVAAMELSQLPVVLRAI
jgi:hypothetical protein